MQYNVTGKLNLIGNRTTELEEKWFEGIENEVFPDYRKRAFH